MSMLDIAHIEQLQPGSSRIENLYLAVPVQREPYSM